MPTKKMAIIATKGALDMAYPPLILASTAAALGWDVQIFFTFYGLQLLRKDLSDVKISPLANPAMPMPVPMPEPMPVPMPPLPRRKLAYLLVLEPPRWEYEEPCFRVLGDSSSAYSMEEVCSCYFFGSVKHLSQVVHDRSEYRARN